MICTLAGMSSSLVPVLSAVATCWGALARSLPPKPASTLGAAVLALGAVAGAGCRRGNGDAVRVDLPAPLGCSCCFAFRCLGSEGAGTTTGGNVCGPEPAAG